MLSNFVVVEERSTRLTIPEIFASENPRLSRTSTECEKSCAQLIFLILTVNISYVKLIPSSTNARAVLFYDSKNFYDKFKDRSFQVLTITSGQVKAVDAWSDT